MWGSLKKRGDGYDGWIFACFFSKVLVGVMFFWLKSFEMFFGVFFWGLKSWIFVERGQVSQQGMIISSVKLQGCFEGIK